MNLTDYVAEIPGWPKEPVTFKDIGPLLLNPKAFKEAVNKMCELVSDVDFDKIVGIDSRGFIFASVLAYKLDKGLVLARKKGKLPPPTTQVSYALEYGEATLEIKEGVIEEGEKILIVDDLMATGGTLKATQILVEKSGGIVSAGAFLIDLRKEIQSSFQTSFPTKPVLSY